ncbi:FAD-binding oxidoreductase [Candidatus Competibacter phosphatis]|uniref:D-lactate dehydrogenase (cytochrome) n=1 Tax=Candidatus Competibacter phosphatis TaxID=221280 RepID=A0ABX1TEE5_9GAMM|nr:FAD-binding and (Fe-S)-binding domain-containing protein [Candidatus Competibacter phosphatis]NMQ17728.1 FAD-binding oxidoreductase [Candidatus Competibacter phosphatis]
MPPTAYEQLHRDLQQFIPAARLIGDPLRTLAYGTDASLYRLIPKLVVRVDSEDEMRRILALAHRHETPVTFRAAGTSLSGQAVTDSVLLQLGDGWRSWRIGEHAATISLQPGIVGGHANRYLAPYRRKIGPDPASINSCQIGGIAANNASGMCCGTAQNSYQTLKSMRVMLADGTVLDTGDSASREAFEGSHDDLLAQLAELGRRTRADTTLAGRIRDKFKIKNTCGYSLNALVDYEDPFEILQHLMIGSEGTLGFIAEITYRTVEEHTHKATVLMIFPDIKTACEAVAMLKSQPVAAVELMDRASLRSVEHKPGMPSYFKELSETAAALLVETRALDSTTLKAQVETIAAALAATPTLLPFQFTDRPEEFTQLWAIRQGLFPSVGSARATGTTVIIEDVAVPVPQLAAMTLDLQDLFDQHGYTGSIIFGHALEGNLHFVITPDFAKPAETERYKNFMDDVCHMIVDRYDGSLKAEHGTGRNIAPFVELEWGRQAHRLMWEIKTLFDPHHLLNPGVILNDDPEAHLKNIKPMAAVDPLVDKCIECGFCEPNCPSRALTLSPRQRIVGLREMARLQAAGEESNRLQAITESYAYQGLETCAADSLCSLTCPVGINTGTMMLKKRSQQRGQTAQRIGNWVAKHFSGVITATRFNLAAANLSHTVFGSTLQGGVTGAARKLSGNRLPLWNRYMPSAGAMPKPETNAVPDRPRVVYFPSCASRTMGPAKGDPELDALPVKTAALLRKAGFEVVLPEDSGSLCCGQPFESKGLPEQADAKRREVEQALLKASRNGQDPIVFDTTPCTLRVKKNQAETPLKLYDITEFLHDVVLERLTIHKRPETVAIHPTCSNINMGLQAKLKAIAETCVEKVIVPDRISCCGWAGDKGFTHPELNASALRDLKAALPEDCTSGYSTSRTCEIGLSLHSGRFYRSIVYLVDRCSQPNTG